MEKKVPYSGLRQLMQRDEQAAQYFSSLPDDVQKQIKSREEQICSRNRLENYAQNLLSGNL